MAINPFPEGQKLLKKAHALAVHFSYINRLKSLHEFVNVVPNQPQIKLQVDLNGTRVAAQHSLLFSEMRMSILLKTYMASKPEAITNPIDESEWKSLSEIEGILNITKWCTSLMPYEQLYTTAFGQVNFYFAILMFKKTS